MNRRVQIWAWATFLAALLLVSLAPHAWADPQLTLSIGSGEEKELSTGLQIVLLITILSLVPAILLMVTSFARIVIVLSFLRQAMATGQMPPNQILLALSLFLTIFIMGPTFQQVNDTALQPYLAGEMTSRDALSTATHPIRAFMLSQTREKDLALFVQLSGAERPRTPDDVPLTVLLPSFMISELKTAFEIGFTLYLPFLIIDLVIASVLMSMGMLMLPPAMISLPFKILLFVLVDGWNLITRSLVTSFQ
ncbi:MAG: flagellar type III secretion system pore protein FliP [Candidatus Eisenbacteria bacterium]|uniref:Flagellar biosynthetic protein FliP n=1 Tax=Eiseniibacteriota bacterium TaxID=2212470 RepID=A0A956N8C0_UNCEI|nr:flagellar type III secretion system pore protein FliP [Candidatus Eisenbacteria bacterium]